MAWKMVAQSVCQQCRLPNTPLSALILACGLSVFPLPSGAQQSTQYGPFELHHSIVYTTFLTPDIAAEYGITRGADKAILTLSVRDTTSGEIAGRPMTIEGRTWDLITGGALRAKEIREGRATYYIVPFEFLDREYRFFEFEFQPEGADTVYEHTMKVQLWRQE